MKRHNIPIIMSMKEFDEAFCRVHDSSYEPLECGYDEMKSMYDIDTL